MDPQLRDLVGRNGRLNYKGLTSLVNQVSQFHFVSYCDHPFLVGKELITGQLSQGSSTDATHTLSFNPADVMNDAKESSGKTSGGDDQSNSGGSSLSRAIYALAKKPMSDSPRNVFTIGRIAGNDVVIADYSVSKRHAQIRLKKGTQYFLSDCHSTNGTYLNGERLSPEKEVELGPDDDLIFGRLEFVFRSPGDLYSMFRSANA